MGRKIPGRKHHGVRDPEKQRAERLKALTNKVNAPPNDPDNQPVSKSLVTFMKLRDKAKGNLFKRKNKRAKRPVIFEQMPGEKDRQFLNRIDRACQEVKREAAFEIKYGVQIKKNADTGEVEEVVKRPKDELELHIEKLRKEKKSKQKKGKKNQAVSSDEPKLTKSQKRQRKLKEKKLKKLQSHEHLDFPARESVRFGDIVHAPPLLPKPRKAEQDTDVSKPGKKDLLLKSLLDNKGENTVENIKKNKVSQNVRQTTKNKSKVKGIDKKGKRKDLPNALRRQLDRQQKEVIEAYKKMKKEKYK